MRNVQDIIREEIVCKFEDANGNGYSSLFAAYQSVQLEKHKDMADVEGGVVYYPKAIKQLKYEIIKQAPNLYKVWKKCGVFLKTNDDLLNTIFGWVQQQLDEAEGERVRAAREKRYTHELYIFLHNVSLINKLNKLLDEAKKNEPKKVDEEKEPKMQFTKCGLSAIFQDLKNEGLIKGMEKDWLSLLIDKIPPTNKLTWLHRKGKSVISLVELLLLVGVKKEEVCDIIEKVFDMKIKGKRQLFNRLNENGSCLHDKFISIIQRHKIK